MRVIATVENVWLPDFQVLITTEESTDLAEKFDAFQIRHSKHLRYAIKKGMLKRVTGSTPIPKPLPSVPKGDSWI